MVHQAVRYRRDSDTERWESQQERVIMTNINTPPPAGLPLCTVEDGPAPCVWDGQLSGNGMGLSFWIDEHGEFWYFDNPANPNNPQPGEYPEGEVPLPIDENVPDPMPTIEPDAPEPVVEVPVEAPVEVPVEAPVVGTPNTEAVVAVPVQDTLPVTGPMDAPLFVLGMGLLLSGAVLVRLAKGRRA